MYSVCMYVSVYTPYICLVYEKAEVCVWVSNGSTAATDYTPRPKSTVKRQTIKPYLEVYG